MSSWLRKRKDDVEPVRVLPPDLEALLPSSVRPPDANRVAPLEPDAIDDEPDEDLNFLAGLVAEVDRAAKPNAADVVAPVPLRGASPRIDDLQVFREMKADASERIQFDHRLSDVDMGDLLEELSTVRAALRRRKAA